MPFRRRPIARMAVGTAVVAGTASAVARRTSNNANQQAAAQQAAAAPHPLRPRIPTSRPTKLGECTPRGSSPMRSSRRRRRSFSPDRRRHDGDDRTSTPRAGHTAWCAPALSVEGVDDRHLHVHRLASHLDRDGRGCAVQRAPRTGRREAGALLDSWSVTFDDARDGAVRAPAATWVASVIALCIACLRAIER